MASSISALFDPTYLPDKLLHRDQELHTVSSLVSPPDETPFPVNVMVHGAFGIGRTTLLRFLGQHELSSYRRPFINFRMKSASEIVCDTLASLTGETDFSGSLPELWTFLKRLLRKAETPIIFTFDDVDRQNQATYTKFLALCKECQISSMATAPRFFPRQLNSETIRLLDYSLELQPFTDAQFLDIIIQRVNAAFPFPLPVSITEFIADIICILDFQRPATAVELLRALYPLVSNSNRLTADQIRQICLSSQTLHYDFWSSHLSSLLDLEATTVLLLEAVGEYFLYNPGHIYVAKPNLFMQYQQVCERSDLSPSTAQFSKALNEILFQDLLLCSRYNSQNYFTLLPAQGYLEIVGMILTATEEC